MFVILGLFVMAAYAADVTGTWTAQVPGRQGNTQEATFKLKADGSTLTGAVVTPRGERPIEDGKVDGDMISFKQTMEFNGNKVVLIYKGHVSGTEIHFTREREGGEGQSQKFTAKKQS
jgi:ferric enterobactin receptor